MPKTSSDKLKLWLKRAIVFVPFAYLVNFTYAFLNSDSSGTFGDTFGAANAIFSGTALVMLIYAVILQRDELYIVQEERNDTKKLLAGQEKINTIQQEALRKQIFDQAFYQLINLLSQELRALDRSVRSDKNYPVIDAAINDTVKFHSDLSAWSEHCRTEEAPIPQFMNEARPVFLLFQNISLFLDSQGIDRTQISMYDSITRSFIDGKVARIWLMYAVYSMHRDRSFRDSFEKFSVIDYFKAEQTADIRKALEF